VRRGAVRSRDPSAPIPFGIKRDLLAYFSDLSKVKYIQSNGKLLARVQADLPVLQTISTLSLIHI